MSLTRRLFSPVGQVRTTNLGSVSNGVVSSGSVYTSPFAAAGFTYVSARDVLTNAWDSVDDTTQHDGTDEADVRRITPTGGSLWTEQTNAADQFYYANGENSRAINGKPVYYTEEDGFAPGMDSDVNAVTMLSGELVDFIGVFKRLTAGDNKAVVQLGNNRPFTCRMYSGDVITAYGFRTAYKEVSNNAFTTGAHVVHIRSNGTQLQVAIDGGTFQSVADSADWSPDTGKFSLGKGNYAVAEYGLYDGNYGDYATLIDALKTEYGIS